MMKKESHVKEEISIFEFIVDSVAKDIFPIFLQAVAIYIHLCPPATRCENSLEWNGRFFKEALNCKNESLFCKIIPVWVFSVWTLTLCPRQISLVSPTNNLLL